MAIVPGQNFFVSSGIDYDEQVLIASAVVNNGTTSVSSSDISTLSNYVAISGAISGAGTIELETNSKSSDSLALTSAVGTGQTIAFVSGDDTLTLGTNAIPAFEGVIAGFTTGDKIVLGGDTATKAVFSGNSIVVTLKTGSTIALATSSALSGSLTILNDIGNTTLTYASTTPNIHDWSATDIGAAPAMRGGAEQAYATPMLAHENVTAWAVMHHGF